MEWNCEFGTYSEHYNAYEKEPGTHLEGLGFQVHEDLFDEVGL